MFQMKFAPARVEVTFTTLKVTFRELKVTSTELSLAVT